MKIIIPENETLFGKGATNLHTYNYILRFLEIITQQFSQSYPTVDINNPTAIEAYIIQNVIKQFKSISLLATNGVDYNSCATLCRSIADQVCVIKLIYASNDEDERCYRHYLYVLDGIEERLNLLNKQKILYDGIISQFEFDALVKQIDDAKTNALNASEFCKKVLASHPYAVNYKEFHSLAVNGNKWKYRKLGEVLINRDGLNYIPVYSWEKLYSLIDERKSIISMFSNYLSQFSHGLSSSHFIDHSVDDNFESILAVGILLQGIIVNELRKRFETIICKLDRIQKDAFFDLISMCSPEKQSDFWRNL